MTLHFSTERIGSLLISLFLAALFPGFGGRRPASSRRRSQVIA